MRVSVDVWLEFFNSLVCGIGTKHLGKENVFRDRKLLHLRSSVIPTWKEMRLADPGSTRVPLCPTRGLSRLPERATIRPSAFL